MIQDLNKWIGEGHIVSNPELRTTHNDYNVVNLSLKINNSYKKRPFDYDSDESVWREKYIYVAVVAWDLKAEKIAQNYKIGDKVRVIGRLNSTRYKNKESDKWNYTYEIVLEDISMLQKAQ